MIGEIMKQTKLIDVNNLGDCCGNWTIEKLTKCIDVWSEDLGAFFFIDGTCYKIPTVDIKKGDILTIEGIDYEYTVSNVTKNDDGSIEVKLE